MLFFFFSKLLKRLHNAKMYTEININATKIIRTLRKIIIEKEKKKFRNSLMNFI